MTNVASPYPDIIRESCEADWRTYERYGKKWADALVAETDARAFAIVKRLGIARPSVRGRVYDLKYICDFTDRPMYLMGPNAPRITSFKTAFEADYRDNPIASYTIVIDDQDHLDILDREWMAGLVAQARKKGIKSLSPQWAVNVIARVKREMKRSE
jgi:hypothetical protein